MRAIAIRYRAAVWSIPALMLLCTIPVGAELAKVFLKNGMVLRGDVRLTRTEAQISNSAGTLRYQRKNVERIEWLEDPATVDADYMRRFWQLPPDDVTKHFDLAAWLHQRRFFEPARRQCEYVLELNPKHEAATALLSKIRQQTNSPETQPATQPARSLLSTPALLDPLDITKIKLSEIELDEQPERLNVRYLRKRGERDLLDLVKEEMRQAYDYDPEWDEVLAAGKLHDKLPIVVKATGLKYASRIDLRGHPEVFVTYRRRVLPMIIKGCGRVGCHGGDTAHVFRFPAGSQTSDEFVYTSFALLDRIRTEAGPLLDRELPEESLLIKYMLPAFEEATGHPPVPEGRRKPVLRDTTEPRYQLVVDWITSLRYPHPDYRLDYEFPDWIQGPPTNNKQPIPANTGMEEKPTP